MSGFGEARETEEPKMSQVSGLGDQMIVTSYGKRFQSYPI